MVTSRPEIAGAIETFIRRQFRIGGDDARFTRDAHLYEGGYVDSAGVVELLLFVEATYGVQLDDEEIFSEQFTTINGIAAILAAPRRQPDECRAAVS